MGWSAGGKWIWERLEWARRVRSREESRLVTATAWWLCYKHISSLPREKMLETKWYSPSGSQFPLCKRKAGLNIRKLSGNFCGLVEWKYFGEECSAVWPHDWCVACTLTCCFLGGAFPGCGVLSELLRWDMLYTSASDFIAELLTTVFYNFYFESNCNIGWEVI